MHTLTAQAGDVVREYADRGTRCVVLTLSRDEHPKTVVMLFPKGAEDPSLALKVGLTPESALAVRAEAEALRRIAHLDADRIDGTVPRVVELREVANGAVLVTTACPGAPMAVRYHQWRHTASPDVVRADFDAADVWLRRLGALSNTSVAETGWATRLCDRWPGEPALDRAAPLVWALEPKLAVERAPGVMHGDFWCGNTLQVGSRITGVIDWEHSTRDGDPLRDRVRFALSYALYLDRHTRPGHRVRGHVGLAAGVWGAGVRHALADNCWCSQVIGGFIGDGLAGRAQPRAWWRDALLLGLAEVAVLGDEAEFARHHLQLLADLAPPRRPSADVAAGGPR